MITRKDRMANRASHSEYYRDVITAMGGPGSIPCPASDDEVDTALAAGDEYLNTIRLGRWDACVGLLTRANTALKERGDYLTLANGVCILKEAARWRHETRTGGDNGSHL